MEISSKAFYPTDLTLDLSGAAHVTPGLHELAGSGLEPFVINGYASPLANRQGAGSVNRRNNWIQAGPDQRTGVYTSTDGSIRIRFDALQRNDHRIRRRDLETGTFDFTADHMLFIVFIERGNLSPTRCIRFVQVKKGHARLMNNVRIINLEAPPARNALLERWTIDDTSEPSDLQLGTQRRRDGLVSTRTCDTSQTKRALIYQTKEC